MPVWDSDDSGGGCVCVGPGGIWELSILSTQFCCELKTALRNKEKKLIKEKKREEGVTSVTCVYDQFCLFVTPWSVVLQAPLSMGFPRQEYWCGLPFPIPGDLSNPGIKPMSLASAALAGGFFTTWEAHF